MTWILLLEFIRRNKTAVITVAVILAVLIGGFLTYWRITRLIEDQRRLEIAEKVTESIESDMKAKQIEKTIENIGIQEKLKSKEVVELKAAVKKAREAKPDQPVTPNDIVKALDDLEIK